MKVAVPFHFSAFDRLNVPALPAVLVGDRDLASETHPRHTEHEAVVLVIPGVVDARLRDLELHLRRSGGIVLRVQPVRRLRRAIDAHEPNRVVGDALAVNLDLLRSLGKREHTFGGVSHRASPPLQ